jgi:DNA-binding transcriptional MocR family regulator
MPTDWIPSITCSVEPRYLAIVTALELDIQSGRVTTGCRLLPQREMAERLKISVGTVSKAYAEAERRGLVSGEVGRGTFVRSRDASRPYRISPSRIINLSLNVAPTTGEVADVASALTQVGSGNLSELLGYLPHQGVRSHREAFVDWLKEIGLAVNIDHVFVTQGGQHGLSIAAALLADPGRTILTESLTYSGMESLAAHAGYRLIGVPLDDEGLIPDALDLALKNTGARVVYAMPNLQTPSGSILSTSRRTEIADILRRRDAFVIEDDVYGFLCPKAPPALSTLVPERGFYLASFAKCLAPGLRIGLLVAPAAYRDRVVNALRASSWMATPIMAQVVAQLIRAGVVARHVDAKRQQAAERHRLAVDILHDYVSHPAPDPAFHVWVKVPPGRAVMDIVAQAAVRGVQLAPPTAVQPLDPGMLGFRVCLGGPQDLDELAEALQIVRSILDEKETILFT